MKKAKILHCQFEILRCYSHATLYFKDRNKLYEVLGLYPNATQSEIKSAYYKLSMMYHPDKNKDSEIAKLKFQEINEAYEVLGNYNLRKKYDKGIFTPKKTEVTYEETDCTDEHIDFKRKELKKRKPPPTGRTQIYNFDEFYRQHYGDAIKHEAKTRREYKEFIKEEKTSKISTFQALIFMITFTGILMFIESELSSYDKPSKVPSKGSNQNIDDGITK